MTSLVEHSDVQLTEYRCLLKTCHGLSNKSLKGFLNIDVIKYDGTVFATPQKT